MEALIKKFLSVSYCTDYGNGSGYGTGAGVGAGVGTGYGHGSSSGTSYRRGFGFDYRYVSGSGYDAVSYYPDRCSGNSDGSGQGYNYGTNPGIKKYDNHTVYDIDGVQTLIFSVHGNYAKGAIINDDLTLTTCFVAKEGNFFAHAKTLKEAVLDAKHKMLEDLPEEERVAKFLEAYPDKDKKCQGREFFDWHHVLTGSCKMGREQFCKEHDIDIDAKYTPLDFLNLCKDAYSGEIIRDIIDRYENNE